MSAGFFVAVSRSELSRERVDSALVAHTLWQRDGGDNDIDIRGRNWSVICPKSYFPDNSKFWTEKTWEGSDYRGSFILLLGWCYRISDFSESLSDNDYREILGRFRADKPPLSEDFGGQYVAVVYDSTRQRLAVQPDRLAQGSAYFASANGDFAASNRAFRLANYFRSALDGHSVLAQMRGTHMPFGRTLFAGVRRLMGATFVEFDLAEGKGQLKKPFSLFVPTQNISYGDSVDAVTDSLKKTVGRLLAASPVRFDLTGGNDTRAISSAVENITRGTRSDHFAFRVADPESSPDVRIARRVAQSCGWSLVRMDRGQLAEATPVELALAATTGDGNYPLHYIWERVASERSYAGQTGQKKWKTHVGAPAGEIFRGYFYAQEMLKLGRSNVNYDALLAYRTYASREIDPRILGLDAPTLEAHDQVLLAPYRAIGEEGGHLPNANKLDLMYLQRHCYRAGNTLAWLSNFLHARLPFLSWELAGLGLSVPWKYRTNRGLMLRVIERLSPKLASIPNEDGQPMKPLSLATLPILAAAEIPIAIDRGRRVIRRFLRKSGGTAESGLPIPQAAFFAILNDARSINALIDPNLISKVCNQSRSSRNSKDSVTVFYVLCTIELLLQQGSALRPQLAFD